MHILMVDMLFAGASRTSSDLAGLIEQMLSICSACLGTVSRHYVVPRQKIDLVYPSTGRSCQKTHSVVILSSFVRLI